VVVIFTVTVNIMCGYDDTKSNLNTELLCFFVHKLAVFKTLVINFLLNFLKYVFPV
jgi:hypothetical protein